MKSKLIFLFYNVLLLICAPFVVLFIVTRWGGRRLTKGFERWSERWGHLSPEQTAILKARPAWWWVHAVSLGEIKAIETFLSKARAKNHAGLLLSAITPEALAYAQEKRLADLVIAAPVDLPWVVRRAVQAVRPRLFISVESEFWPNLLRESKRAGARVALINGRLSERSFRSYHRVKFLLSPLWECFDLWAVREAQDAARLEKLGVPSARLQVTGNLKYDLASANAAAPINGPRRLTIVVGSTREKEEAVLIPVMEKLRTRHAGLRVVWAPRHLERVGEIETLFSGKGISYEKKSRLPSGSALKSDGAACVLWDSLGDLLDAYRHADVAVIGGSFVPKGGQNPIEPAALSVPVVFGPSMDNFYAVAEALLRGGGARQVTVDALEECLEEILSDAALRQKMGERAREAVEGQQGATERTLRLLEGLAPVRA